MKVTKKHKQEKIKEAIKFLNEAVKIRIAPSGVHGVGVFALRDIKKGEKLYTDFIPHALDIPFKDFKKLRPEIAELILGRWPTIVKGFHFLYPDTKMSAYLNHSDTPNYDGKEDKALKKIRAGEEVLEDYKQIEGWEKIYKWLS